MTETQSIVNSMSALTDDEVRAVVAAATTGRPALAALRAAALEIRLVPEPVAPPVPTTPDVPAPPVILDADVVPDPHAVTNPNTVPGGVVAPDVAAVTGYTEGGVPTFDAVREKIETRAGTADGGTELDAASSAGRNLEEQFAAREKAAKERLDEIRKSLHRD
ncbi:hypothetical protein [Rhodococcus sp. NPDC003348]